MKPRRLLLRVVTLGIAAPLAALVVASCTKLTTEDTPTFLGAGCLLNSDCTDPLVCVFGKCHSACSGDRDCPAAQRCVEATPPARVCQLPEESTCHFTSDCPGTQICAVDAHCRDQCESARDCADGQLCTGSVCASPSELVDGGLPLAGPPLGASCSFDSDCTAPTVCRDGSCTLACAADVDCPAQSTCFAGTCLPDVCGAMPTSTPTRCTYDSECAGGGQARFCVQGVCNCQCLRKRDCPAGDKCIDGACQRASTDPCPGPACDLSSSKCLAVTDNAAKSTIALRVGQFRAVEPPAFAQALVQNSFFDKAMGLRYENCNLKDDALLSWLLRWNLATGELSTGGGPPIADGAAAKTGTCFIDLTDATSGFHVAPKTVHSAIADDGSFQSDPIDELNLPIFADANATSQIVLPLRKLVVSSIPGTGLTANDGAPARDGNCIGTYDGSEVDVSNGCQASTTQSTWIPAARVEGFISLEESDKVMVPLRPGFNVSLCVLIANDPTYTKYTDPTGHCVRENGRITLRGDWDAATNTAGGARDANRFAGLFAASAIEVGGTGTKRDCSDAK